MIQVAGTRGRDLPQKPVCLILAAHSRWTTETVANCSWLRPEVFMWRKTEFSAQGSQVELPPFQHSVLELSTKLAYAKLIDECNIAKFDRPKAQGGRCFPHKPVHVWSKVIVK